MRQAISLNRVQRGLLASHLSAPGKGHQNAALVIRIGGPVDAEKLVFAFEAMVRSSDALRTIVRQEASAESGIVVAPDVPAPTKVVDASVEDFEAWCQHRARRRIDLSRSCYDSRIARHSDGTATWFLNIHHIVNDAFSAKFVLEKVSQAYAGTSPKIEPYYNCDPFLAAEVQTQQTQRAVPDGEQPKLDRLYGFLSKKDGAALNLTFPNIPQSVEAACTGPYRLLTPTLTETVFWVFATAAFLYRVTGASTFTLGMTVSHRGDARFQDTVGPRFDVYPVPIDVPPKANFRDLHSHVVKSVMATLSQAELGQVPDGDVDALINFIPTSAMPDTFLGHPVSISYLQSEALDPSQALRLHLTPYCTDATKRGPTLAIDIAADGAAECSATQIMAHFENLLAAAADTPNMAVLDAPVLSNADVNKLNSFQPKAAPKSIALDRALRKSLKGQDRTVLSCGETRLSGDALWRWSAAIATHLEATSAPARIGVGIQRSIEAVALIYGILLSGRSFVPIDPALPKMRRAEICDIAGLEFSFDTAAQVEELRDGEIAEIPTQKPSREAYVMFTSGSTGKPKGVPISVSGLQTYLTHAVQNYFVGLEKPVAPLFSSLGFDLTLTTLFAPIIAGGEIVTFADHPATAMAEIAKSDRFNWMKATPSHLDIYLTALEGQHRFQHIVVGGEDFSTSLAKKLIGRSEGQAVKLVNEYGPTEAVIGCMTYGVDRETIPGSTSIPIGDAIAGVDLQVMDASGQPAVPYAMGELWISHPGVFQKYIGQTPKSSNIRKFNGTRYYASGDLVSRDPTDCILYHGRSDQQLKVGGARLDPVEIETALTSHPAIERAVVRIWEPSKAQPRHHCTRCGLPDTVPGASFDDTGVCTICKVYDEIQPRVQSWFKTPQDLGQILSAAATKSVGEYTCMHLLSGGKDSTFALYQIVDMGHRPYVVTLDNGYISEGAKSNIDRVVARLGLDHEYLTTPAMAQIFQDSLKRYSNVCNGCYKTIYTLATLRAKELGIPVILTGLSRGQLFETRLAPQQFSNPEFEPNEIDRAILAARLRYHRAEDAVRRLLDTSAFDDDQIFQNIAYVDFYRYVDVPVSEMLDYLAQQTDWARPSDTGRSTNCLVNETGIHVHLTERGFHNYAIPYAWDVRLGHKTRDEAMAELNDEFAFDRINSQLQDIDYHPAARSLLTAWYVCKDDIAAPSAAELRAYLSDRLPQHAMPHSFTVTNEIGVSSAGKVDVLSLPVPARALQPRVDVSAQAATPLQEEIIGLWERVLGQTPIGIDDDFFALGGDSLSALTMVFELQTILGRRIAESHAFQYSTPRSLAEALEHSQIERPQELAEPTLNGPPLDPASPPAMTEIEEEIYLAQRSDPEGVQYNIGQVFYLPVACDADQLNISLDAAIARHSPLCWTYGTRRKFLATDNRKEIIIAQNTCDKSEVETLHIETLRRVFEVENGPFLRAVYQPLS